MTYLAALKTGPALTNLCPDPQGTLYDGAFWPATIYNVMDFGADDTGATDSRSAFQAAINAAHSTGGGIVTVPAGTFVFHSVNHLDGDTWNHDGTNLAGIALSMACVVLRNGVTIIGAGSALTHLTTDHYACAPIGANYQHDIGIADMDITTTYAYPGNGVNAFKIMACDRAFADNITSSNLYIGIAFVGCHDSIARNCYSTNCEAGYMMAGCNPAGVVPQVTDNIHLANCEADACEMGFRVLGYSLAYDAENEVENSCRIDNVTLTDCDSHDSPGGDFRVLFASNISMLRCTASSGLAAKKGIALVNVDTAHLTDCTTAWLCTASNGEPAWYAAQDSQDRVDIVED